MATKESKKLKFVVTYIEKNVAEDSYEHGVSGKETTVHSKDHVGSFGTLEAMMRGLAQYGYPDTIKDYYVMDDGRLVASALEDGEGSEPNKQQTEAWKKGEAKLYLADYEVLLEIASVEIPTVDELHKLGFEVA